MLVLLIIYNSSVPINLKFWLIHSSYLWFVLVWHLSLWQLLLHQGARKMGPWPALLSKECRRQFQGYWHTSLVWGIWEMGPVTLKQLLDKSPKKTSRRNQKILLIISLLILQIKRRHSENQKSRKSHLKVTMMQNCSRCLVAASLL